jgi:Cytochrome P460
MKPVLAAALLIALMVEPAIPMASDAASRTAPFGIALPADYRSWRHVKTQIANDRALQGLRSRRFEDGAMLVAEFRDLDRKGNVIDGGAIRLVDVMLFDARRFADTDGWGYAEFIGPGLNSRTFDSRAECHACHTKRAERGYVFSELPG